MSNSIAIVGLACCFPDARSPDELWENVLAQRQAFRRLPNERLRLDDYWSNNPATPDCIYSSEAALIEGYEFDRSQFCITGETFRSADLTHWLALDIASRALQDAGFVNGEGLRRESTGVFLGNTLTGEFSRAATLRLRWPFVRRVIGAALADDWSNQQRREFFGKLEKAFKKPFPPINEESLAGGLSNTIAGRICNHFDFKGGGYTVDGACASSLIALINGCTALVNSDLDTALVGGVDLSLDPFELVGFAKAGALATDTMRVYDARSNGFWPGEGCGFVVLMRLEDALAQSLRTYAVIRGWGISSDGSGGITRPEIEGQMLALKRAYQRAGFGIDSVAYVEGHGTGTAVGDTVELQSLSNVRRETSLNGVPTTIGSVKANIGHTKAAAGVAGLIKATLALNTGIIPPTTGCETPHPALCGETPALRIIKKAEAWPNDRPRRAGVSSMGFGGINAHVVLESVEDTIGCLLKSSAAISSAQDAELFLFSSESREQLLSQIEILSNFTYQLSRAELTDLSVQLQQNLPGGKVRAAIIAATPAELSERLQQLRTIARNGETKIDPGNGVYFTPELISTRVGLLFPGQGSPSYISGGALRRRFDFVEEIYRHAGLQDALDGTQTEVAQPAIVMNSLATLRVLSKLNITAEIAVGHSLGELTAMCWAGAFSDSELLDLAQARGQAMGQLKGPHGGMMSVTASEHEVLPLLNGDDLSVAAFNSDFQTVVSGELGALTEFSKRAQAHGLSTTRLPVSHAFHSWLVADATAAFATCLSNKKFAPLQRQIVSTVTGNCLSADADLADLLKRQITSPVRFLQAVKSASVDLWIEAGPGHVLKGLMKDITDVPVISIDAGGESLKGLLNAIGAAFVLRQHIDHRALVTGRFSKPFNLNWRPKFFVNPCELAPLQPPSEKSRQPDKVEEKTHAAPNSSTSALDFLKQLIAKRGELPALAISNQSRFLSDLHLNSIIVSQLVGEAARYLGLPRLASATDFADATIEEAARALEEQLSLSSNGDNEKSDLFHDGVDSWVRPFRVELVERGLRLTDRKQVDPIAESKSGTWKIFAANDSHFVKALRRKFAGHQGPGVVVVLSTDSDESIVATLLQAAQEVLCVKEQSRFVLVQEGRGAAAFARTLHLEAPRIKTCVVNVPQSHLDAVDRIVEEALAAGGYAEAHYDDQGRRFEPVVRLITTEPPEALALSSGDLILVSGGGKGITAECALALAKKSGVRLALIGRSHPDSDPELSSNLERFKSAGIVFKYISADITNADQIRAVLEELQEEWGAVTGMLHGAARNEPRLLNNLDRESFRQTLLVKVQGARNLLAAVDPQKLKLLVAFSSIIARTGLPGEADYGLANEWLTDLTEEWKATHPHCRCLAVEWSIWAGKGMGERLGRADRLLQQGITPIPLDAGVETLLDLLHRPLPTTSVIAMSRFRDLPTFKIERPELPFLRFLEQPRVFFPGIELVVDVDFSKTTDPYLEDHVFQGERLFPAVMGLEAMTQAASALTAPDRTFVLENIKFNRSIIVPDTGSLTIRLAALKRVDGTVEVALRSQETGFHVNHFEATCRFAGQTIDKSDGPEWPSALPLAPSDLYGRILFQSGRFRRIKNYRVLRATECITELATDKNASWFSQYLPGQLLLGDAGARDAVLHSIQACIPHRTILPVSVDRVIVQSNEAAESLFSHALERAQSQDEFTYDVTIMDAAGRVRERWEGLRLRAVAESIKGPELESLLGTYIERRVQELIPGSSISVALIECEEEDRSMRRDRAIRNILGDKAKILRRLNGRPETAGGQSLSLSHTANLTLAITSSKSIACDLEVVVERSASIWFDLLGEHWSELANAVARTNDEDFSISATRIWTAMECLKKVGITNTPPLLLRSETSAWIVLETPSIKIASFLTNAQRSRNRLCLAILLSQ